MELALPNDVFIRADGVYLVGGSVRDLLCHRQPTDYDIVVADNPKDYAEQLAQRLNGRLVLLGKKTFPLYRVVTPLFAVDVTPLDGDQIASDLLKRDFTINALALELVSGNIIDTTGGLLDMEKGVVRMVSPDAFQKDPVRLVRAFRMAARFGFSIEAATMEAISRHAVAIQNCAGERVWAELAIILANPNSFHQLRKMGQYRLLMTLFPEIEALQGCRQNRFHSADGYTHTLLAFNAMETLLIQPDRYLPHHGNEWSRLLSQEHRVLLKLAILLHDIGKPIQRTTDADGQAHFHDHANVGAQMAASVFQRLRLPKRHAKWAEFIIAQHQRPLDLFLTQRQGGSNSKAVGRFLRICGDRTPYLILHAMADHMGKKIADHRIHRARMDFFKQLWTTYVETTLQPSKTPLMRGAELMAKFNLSPSPLVGTLLRGIEEARLAGSIKDRQGALVWVTAYLKQKGMLPE